MVMCNQDVIQMSLLSDKLLTSATVSMRRSAAAMQVKANHDDMLVVLNAGVRPQVEIRQEDIHATLQCSKPI